MTKCSRWVPWGQADLVQSWPRKDAGASLALPPGHLPGAQPRRPGHQAPPGLRGQLTLTPAAQMGWQPRAARARTEPQFSGWAPRPVQAAGLGKDLV